MFKKRGNRFCLYMGIGLLMVMVLSSLFLFFDKLAYSFHPENDKDRFATSRNRIPKVDNKAQIPKPIAPNNVSPDPYVDPEIKTRPNKEIVDSPDKTGIDHVVSYPVDRNDKRFPLLYADKKEWKDSPNRTVYLTFDDGPSPITIQVLDILKEKNVKATFFVIGNQVELYPDILKRTVEEGHAIGIHTDTHNYDEIYASLDAFLLDNERCYEKIKKVIDYPVSVSRYPGGSNSGFNKTIRTQTHEELNKRGIAYFDWNVSSGDAAPGGITKEQYLQNVLNGVQKHQVSIVLTHDAMGRSVTAESIGIVIDELLEQGYTFDVLNNAVKPVQFSSLSN